MTVSKFDIAITLPNDYEQDQLSFVPPTDKWVEQKLGREYILPAAQGAASKTPVFIAFPSPFKSGQQFAQVVIGSAIALVLLIVQGRVALERKLGMRTIIIAFVLSLLAIIATFYFFLTVAEPLEFMAWAAGPLIPVITASFTCIWLLIAIRAEAEVSGRITSGGESARYVTVSVVTLREGVEVILKQMTVKLDGNYRFFIWCGRSDRSVFIVASGTGTTRAKSETFAVAAGAKIHVPAIDVQRIPIALPTGQTAPTHADATATRGASSITGTPTY
jgi:mannose-6-phosphate isomerase-like protein (cupin superfamily)